MLSEAVREELGNKYCSLGHREEKMVQIDKCTWKCPGCGYQVSVCDT